MKSSKSNKGVKSKMNLKMGHGSKFENNYTKNLTELKLKESSFEADKEEINEIKARNAKLIKSKVNAPEKIKEIEENDNDNDNDENNDTNSESQSNSQSEDYDDIRKERKGEKQNKRNIGLIAKTLLTSQKQVLPFKKEKEILKQEDEYIELLKKKKEKINQRRLGYVGNLTRDWNDGDLNHEKALLKLATKGVVKLFNCVYEIKRDVLEEKKQEKIESEKKSKNFLMTHDLLPTPTTKKIETKKTYSEDL